jgi:hypothetical protein
LRWSRVREQQRRDDDVGVDQYADHDTRPRMSSTKA